jgi:hypothetical protein
VEDKKPLNRFEEVHKRAREAADRACEMREKDSELRRKKVAEEAVREGFAQPGESIK